ncbi:phosphodiester glycosidase family protein [Paenibacillus typhae]|uniref:Copper amine oxidase N-terminal domain-containing protein n=1 Tax=Paenibacillus typhae TaxID=1174501 RepID=A0A1G8TXX0_9BACL|nr:phosphodiester glycosidase family protein [Paenibacillus typhae]SDJ45560.1 Copper amine oxidase N-terminal domain-containing protein [Paenibacillus typhae]
MFKKCTAVCLILLLMLSALPSLQPGSTASASAAPKNAVFVDKASQSYIPLRFLNGLFGIRSVLNAGTNEIEISGENTSVLLKAGQARATVNDKSVTLTALPFSANGTTYVPLSVVSTAMGIGLKWNKGQGSITLSSAGEEAVLPVLGGTLIKPDAPAAVSAKHTYRVGSRSFSVQTVTIPLMHPSVRLDAVLAGNTVGKTEALGSIAKRSGAVAAINGTFFDAYTDGAYKAPYGYIISGGKMLKNSPGDKRIVFAYDRNLLAELIPGSEFSARFQSGSIEGALQAGPRLLVNGSVSLNVAAEGFKDPKILTGGGARSALGITRDHKLILLTTGGATIPQLAQIMKQAGAYQAMNLDGGASSGLYYNGKYLTAPGRLISNALVVTR